MRFRALQVDPANQRWLQLFREMWPAYRQWYFEKAAERPTLVACAEALERHMPELVPTWRDLSALSGAGEDAARILSLYNPPPYIFGCSQAVWAGEQPFLIRNYDFSPALAEGVILHTSWPGARVLGMSDCLWGLVDGLNEHGLAVSLTFGGRKETGDGFGIPLILRYVLQVARNCSEAVEILERVPSHMSYNVIALDARGEYALVEMAPDRPVRVRRAKLSTNHQQPEDWPGYAARSKTLERARFIAERLADDTETAESFTERFADDPLYHTDYDRSFGTLYTAVYEPKARRAEYIWPGFLSRQSIDKFREGEAQITLGGGQVQVDETLYQPASQGPPAAADWQKFVVDAPGDWQKYLPDWMRP